MKRILTEYAEPAIVLGAVTLVTMTVTSALYTVLHEPQEPHHAVVVQDGTVDIWTADHLHMIDGVLYITDTTTVR